MASFDDVLVGAAMLVRVSEETPDCSPLDIRYTPGNGSTGQGETRRCSCAATPHSAINTARGVPRMAERRPDTEESAEGPPAIVGDVVFGNMESPVAICTLGSRALLPELAGRPEIAVAGRVFTENVGVERMVQNLAEFGSVRFLIVCGRETRHRVGQTILALHRSGLDADLRVIGSDAPEPIMPSLTPAQLRSFQGRIAVVDMIGVVDAEEIVARARVLATLPATGPDKALEAGGP